MFNSPDSRWRALQTRNPLAVSAFLYGVTTTHIYCRPTCPSRLARRANVVFFDSSIDAESAGFRACKRCKPSQDDFEPTKTHHAQAVRKACELMDAAGGRLSLEDLAGSVNLSPRYFHGIFKGVMGVTPSVYATRVRKEKASRSVLGRETTEKLLTCGEELAPCLNNMIGKGTVSQENGTPFPLHQVTSGPKDLGQTVLEPGHSCGYLDQWVLENSFLRGDSPDALDNVPYSLGNDDGVFSLLDSFRVHDMEAMMGQGEATPSIAQLPDFMGVANPLHCGDLAGTCSWGWVG